MTAPQVQAEDTFTAGNDSHASADLSKKQDIAELCNESKRDMKKMTLRLIIRFGGVIFVAANIGPIISKLLHLLL